MAFCCIPTEIVPLYKMLKAGKRVVQPGSISYHYLRTLFAISLLQHGHVAHLRVLLLGRLTWHSRPPGLTSPPRETWGSPLPSTAPLVPLTLCTAAAVAGQKLGTVNKPLQLCPLPLSSLGVGHIQKLARAVFKDCNRFIAARFTWFV